MRDEAIRLDVRDMLRHGGYKPTGRGKPASEYLLKLADKGLMSINLAVDACNVVSLHSGLPISVVDLDRTEGALRIAVVEGDQRYVFNASGQEIRLEGLLCLHDENGPCANAVKDSERTKNTQRHAAHAFDHLGTGGTPRSHDESRRLVPPTLAKRSCHRPMKAAKICIGLAAIAHIVGYLMAQGEHIADAGWPLHARFHTFQALMWIIALDASTILVALKAITERWGRWYLLAAGTISHFGYFITLAVFPDGGPDTGMAAHAPLAAILILYFAGVTLALRRSGAAVDGAR